MKTEGVCWIINDVCRLGLASQNHRFAHFM